MLGPWHRLWWAVPIILLGLSIGQFVHHAFFPEDGSTMRAIALWLRDHRQPGQAIYLAADGYQPDGTPRTRVSGRNLELLCYWPDPGPPLSLTLPAPQQIPYSSFWVVYSLSRPTDSLNLNLNAWAGHVQNSFTNSQAGALFIVRDGPPPN
jgi:hypothetical protein